MKRITFAYIILICLTELNLLGQQININRIELMPNRPQPYLMRNWKQVALGYDSLVFNFNTSGEYLPLISLNTNTHNYPAHNSFNLHTVVGTSSPTSSEAINCLPAAIGASLTGKDKSNQDGNNFVLMCEEWFNKRPEQNVYKNHPVDDTYDDWWYETMPNVFFYELYDLYPQTGDFSSQFISVADRWLEAVYSMNGSMTPWQVPYMNYRGWDLSTMTPYDADVKEPESAGALAWILYNAYVETGNEHYRIGAELCMEFLDELTSNPSYELQLAYGVYTAARMNTEIGTNYDVNKLINWCFEVGSLRDWGAIVGRWGNYDVNGLIGEVNGNNDYAFLMNTLEQIGALVPLVRYNEHYARAIGKWVLNAANASRLFYANYLPANHQDSENWAYEYDPNSYIGHEAMREEKYGSRPYATGDAIDGGWGETNLALYASSHVGILGGIIDTTSVPMILKLDLLKTDYFGKPAYPTFLFYNPYETAQTVQAVFPEGTYDIYDAITNSVVGSSTNGSVEVSIPADGVVIAVLIPSGSTITNSLNKSYANNIIIDFDNGVPVANHSPRIKSLSAEYNQVTPDQSIYIYCSAVDLDTDNMNYSWNSSGGTIEGFESMIEWKAPSTTGDYSVECIVDDGDKKDTASVIIQVLEFLNNNPVIKKMTANPRKININESTQITCNAEDEDGDELQYTFYFNGAELISENNSVFWNAPNDEGDYLISCFVTDERSGETRDSIVVRVRDFSMTSQGNLMAFYPFNGDGNDASGNNLNGIINGVNPVTDRFGNSNSAYYFDGNRDNITVSNNALLNFQDAISISFWMKVGEFFEREAYPISHGNWENRWKISITNNRIRWTIKTSTGITDLDSETILDKGLLYHVVVLYSGIDYEIYLNGNLDALSTYSGLIQQTNYDLMVGQVLPGNTQYNFKGELDDIRIYDYALSYDEIQDLYDLPSAIEDKNNSKLPVETFLEQNYPNPFNAGTVINFSLVKNEHVEVEIFDVLGNSIIKLLNRELSQGRHSVIWNGSGNDGNMVSSGIYFYSMRTKGFHSIKKLLYLK